MPHSTLKTIGHSTLSIGTFLHALQEHGCEMLVDVRRYAGSRRHPQFGQKRLFASQAEVGIGANKRERLNNHKKTQPNSLNNAWRNEAFRGYADYMQTPEFAAEIDWLTQQKQERSAVVMCA